jgi:hypothetical protein
MSTQGTIPFGHFEASASERYPIGIVLKWHQVAFINLRIRMEYSKAIELQTRSAALITMVGNIYLKKKNIWRFTV